MSLRVHNNNFFFSKLGITVQSFLSLIIHQQKEKNIPNNKQMRFSNVIRVLQNNRRNISVSPLLLFETSSSPSSFSRPQLHSNNNSSSSFGIAFDIDGVIIRGETPIGNSPQALKRLYDDSGNLKIPYLFLTNGGGVPESQRAADLSSLLGVNILTSQVLQGHTPFKNLADRFQNALVLAVGKGEPATVMSEYGFKNVMSIDEYASYFDNIDPLSHYKHWTCKKEFAKNNTSKEKALTESVKAAFIVSDPVDWSRDIQVLCDILRYGGIPQRETRPQPPVYFASDDLEYQAAYPLNRLGMGAFRIALESIFNRISDSSLVYTSFGKPNPFVFKNAEAVLKQLLMSTHYGDNVVNNGESGCQTFKTLYMIGDNPSVDIKGAQQAGHPWFSILTRTGVFKGMQQNDREFPADLVVDTVEDAIDYILKREC
ncbi:hypothetical protein AQUCO_02700149v1 [Aquilegia coerulea]|uniref:Uncharacterized protein n=1 Tax=Aquilegia coerulea TaxID=218851 RepID=A0A2G5D5H3_AQUCA|nr:hypothetical protein AQUCO_02700149v1 [Aquilegia coerulea]